MIRMITASLALWIFVAALVGVLYPISVYIFGQAFYPFESNGSLLLQNNRIVASRLIGMPVSRGDRYFQCRPSLAFRDERGILIGASSNLAQSNPKLRESLTQSIVDWQSIYPDRNTPAEMVFASASGLDPNISTESAIIQADRIAALRNMPLNQVIDIIQQNRISYRLLDLDFVNVVSLNEALDHIKPGVNP